MPVLNARCATEGPRRRPNTVQAPTSAAPAGPTRTAAAKVAVEFADQERFPGRRRVAVDSQITRSKPRTATSRQKFPLDGNGPKAIRTAATATTVAM